MDWRSSFDFALRLMQSMERIQKPNNHPLPPLSSPLRYSTGPAVIEMQREKYALKVFVAPVQNDIKASCCYPEHGRVAIGFRYGHGLTRIILIWRVP